MIQLNQEETQVLKKLQQIVPIMPKDGQVSNLDILENVIQYIMILQEELEQEPNNQIAHTTSTLLQECSHILQNSNLQSKSI